MVQKQAHETEEKARELDEAQKAMNIKLVEFETQRDRFEQEKKLVADVNAASSDVLTLDISGEKTIKVSRALLTQVKGSSLDAMFSGRHTLTVLEGGAIFVDRDADVFQLVVSFLRNGCRIPVIADEFLRERFKLELEYWNLDQPVDNKIGELRTIFTKLYRENTDTQVVAKWKKAGPFNL